MRIRLIIFDLDGVLVDSFDAWYEAHKAGFERFGLKTTVSEFREKQWGIPFPVVFGGSFPGQPEKTKEASRITRETFLKNSTKIKVFDGVPEMLDRLRSMNIKIAISSNTPKAMVENVLKNAGLSYDFIAAPPDVKSKPDPEGILMACEMLGIGKNEAIYLGDTRTDEQAGKNAGIRTLIVGRDIKAAPEVLKQI